MKTYRILKREAPDQEKVERRFGKLDDAALLDAIANPEHSEAARKILAGIAAGRSLDVSDARHWAQSEAALYVPPWGERPSLEEAMAAPRRRWRIYRGLQFTVLLCFVLAVGACQLSERSDAAWLGRIEGAGLLAPGVMAEWREASPLMPESGRLDALTLRDAFLADLRATYVAVLAQSDWAYADIVADWSANGISDGEIIDQVNALPDAPPDFLAEAKTVALSAQVDALSELIEAESGPGGDTAVADQFRELDTLLAVELERLAERGHETADALFDELHAGPSLAELGERRNPYESAWIALVLAGAFTWIVVIPVSWRRPYRVLLLRPFQAKKVSRSLRRFVRREVAFSGHVFTLADKYVKESRLLHYLNWIPRNPVELLMLPLYFLPPVRHLQRWLLVNDAGDYRFLRKRMARRKTLNMFWQNSFNKLLTVKASDTWWRQCVDLMMYSCHTIVVDLSWVKSGTEWELEKIDRRDLEQKTVLVVAEDAQAYAREVIARYWPSEEPPPPLHVYDTRGRLLDRQQWAKDFARTVSQSHLWSGPGRDEPAGEITPR